MSTQDDRLAFELSRRQVIVLAAFALLAIAALYLLLPHLAGIGDTWARIKQGDPLWLAVAGVCTVGTFAGYTLQFQSTYESRLRPRESLQICLAALAASRVFSAGGAGGLILQSWALRRRGLEAREVADRTLGFLVLQYLIYTVSLAVAGFALAGEAPFAMTVVPATVATVVTVVGLTFAFVPTDLHRRLGTRLAHVPAAVSTGIRLALARLRSPDGAVVGAVAFWAFQLGVLLASFEAFGDAPGPAVLIVGFFVGMVGNLLPLPGGIGGVEGGMIGAFAALGIDSGLAVVVVLTFRAFIFWLPTVPGVIAFLYLVKQ